MLCGPLQRAVSAASRRSEPRRVWLPVVCSQQEAKGGGKRRPRPPGGSHRHFSRWAFGGAVGIGSVGWAFIQVRFSTSYRAMALCQDFEHSRRPRRVSIKSRPISHRRSMALRSHRHQMEPNEGPITKLVLISGASCIPHPEKMEKGGEDAYFISDDGLSVGVADGVGGWALSGVDAGKYARLLMKTAKEAAEKSTEDDESKIPKSVLTEAHGLTNVPGSSTACILRLDCEGSCLHASNLGDSGFFILRKDTVVFKSPPQQYQFNFPYQIGYDTSLNNTPDQAEDFCVDVQPGDVIVTGTDGLWDNVFVEECARIVVNCRDEGLCPEECSLKVARFAQEQSLSLESRTPFLKGAKENGYSYYGGGKPDDVTVVVSYVSQGNAKL